MKIFERKKCDNCGEKIKDEWDFCPHCGEQLKEPFMFSQENIFNDVEKEFKRIDKMFTTDFDFPKFDMRMPKVSNGINIVIRSGTGMQPHIEVKTSGNYKKIEPEIKRNLGVKPIVENVEKSVRRISSAEEPDAEIKNLGNKQTIQIKLPNVKSFNDIEVKKLEQSLEIKAFAKNKTYFKLIPIPQNSEIVNKEFKNDILKIDLEK